MRAVVQRVKQSSVKTGGEVVGQIGQGLLVLLGVARGDGDQDVDFMVNKIINLRIFEDENGKMNRSLLEIGGELLAAAERTGSEQGHAKSRRISTPGVAVPPRETVPPMTTYA